jgi:hypothetical protein
MVASWSISEEENTQGTAGLEPATLRFEVKVFANERQ